jgi:hypothetical protein
MRARTGGKTTDEKAGVAGSGGSRHAKPDAHHQGLDGKRIGDANGHQAAGRPRAYKSSQASHE